MHDYLICIDVGKNSHWANVITPLKDIIVKPLQFSNDIKGYNRLLEAISPYLKKNHLVGMEDTGHYGDNLRIFLLDHSAGHREQQGF